MFSSGVVLVICHWWRPICQSIVATSRRQHRRCQPSADRSIDVIPATRGNAANKRTVAYSLQRLERFHAYSAVLRVTIIWNGSLLRESFGTLFHYSACLSCYTVRSLLCADNCCMRGATRNNGRPIWRKGFRWITDSDTEIEWKTRHSLSVYQTNSCNWWRWFCDVFKHRL